MLDHINTLAGPTASISREDVQHLYGGHRATIRLDIVVVGAGIGGLAAAHTLAHAGHRVTVLEYTRKLRDRGAGIQITPNATRLLLRWGLGSALEACAVESAAIVFRRYNTGECVGRTSWGERMERDYGARCYHIHRADYQKMLLHLAEKTPGVKILFGHDVRDVQPDPEVAGGPSVTLASGEVLHADLIVGADGVRSAVRKALTGPEDRPRPTGDTAYCAILHTDRILEDSELRPFVENLEMTVWMAPRRHLMACCIVSVCFTALPVPRVLFFMWQCLRTCFGFSTETK
jgi:salicylate hydroxylase